MPKTKIRFTSEYLILCLILVCNFAYSQAPELLPGKLYAGWSSKSITPDKPFALGGGFNMRVTTDVLDPITCTALVLETRDGNRSIETAIMVSCDLGAIRGGLTEAVKEILKTKLPGIDLTKLLLNATHTHTAVQLTEGRYNIPEGVMQVSEYVQFAAERIAAAVVEAWNNRKPAGMSWGLGQAVVGHNRRAVYFEPVPSHQATGTAVMYGKTKNELFSHIEGYEDHGLEMLFFWDENKKLTGIMMNIACPAQETEGIKQLSADYWHEVREELRKRYGPGLLILPQIAPSGDLSPHLLWRTKAETEMMKRKGITRRQEIALRVADAVDQVYPYVQNDIQNELVFSHKVEELNLSARKVTREEKEQAEILAAKHPNWASWHNGIIDRYNTQDENPHYKTRIHVMRLGDVALATNQFELFLDYGVRIKSRSDAVITMLVQLADGPGTYLPTVRAEAGGGYSAIAGSNLVGSEGGQELVESTLKLINYLWK